MTTAQPQAEYTVAEIQAELTGLGFADAKAEAGAQFLQYQSRPAVDLVIGTIRTILDAE